MAAPALAGLVLAGLVSAGAVAGGLLWWPRPAPPPGDVVAAAAPAATDRQRVWAVFGTSLSTRAIWPAELSAALASCGIDLAAPRIMATPGVNSDEGVKAVRAAPDGYDIVIIEFAINDADLWDGISLARSRANHAEMISALRTAAPGAVIVLMATNPVSGLQRLKRPRLQSYYDEYRSLAIAAGTSFFDGTARWRGASPDAAALPDGLHPDPGAEAAIYTAPLAALVAESLGLRCAPPPG